MIPSRTTMQTRYTYADWTDELRKAVNLNNLINKGQLDLKTRTNCLCLLELVLCDYNL